MNVYVNKHKCQGIYSFLYSVNNNSFESFDINMNTNNHAVFGIKKSAITKVQRKQSLFLLPVGPQEHETLHQILLHCRAVVIHKELES